MYSPKIKEDLISSLYRKAKAEGMPMTKLVDQIIRDVLNSGRSKKEREKGAKR